MSRGITTLIAIFTFSFLFISFAFSVFLSFFSSFSILYFALFFIFFTRLFSLLIYCLCIFHIFFSFHVKIGTFFRLRSILLRLEFLRVLHFVFLFCCSQFLNYFIISHLMSFGISDI